jgi:hypothetical protein
MPRDAHSVAKAVDVLDLLIEFFNDGERWIKGKLDDGAGNRCLVGALRGGKTLFAQLMDFLPWSTFTRIVARYDGDQRVRTLSCGEHYRAMAFAQLTYRESLRDIETCLSVKVSKLYSMGFRDPVRRSRSATAASKRSPAILTVSAMPARIDCRSWLIAAARSAVDIATARPSSTASSRHAALPDVFRAIFASSTLIRMA